VFTHQSIRHCQKSSVEGVSRRRLIFLVGTTGNDPERVIRQRSLQRPRFAIVGRPPPAVSRIIATKAAETAGLRERHHPSATTTASPSPATQFHDADRRALTFHSPCPSIIGPVLSGTLCCVREREEAVTASSRWRLLSSPTRTGDRQRTASCHRASSPRRARQRHTKKPPEGGSPSRYHRLGLIMPRRARDLDPCATGDNP
jgi:hypothetical protein